MRSSAGRFAAATVAGWAVVLLPSLAGAETLQRLHVSALTLFADRTVVKPNERFFIKIYAHVAERINRLQNLPVPPLGDLEILGDEHRIAWTNGSDYLETITVAARAAGNVTVGPAHLDAIDARSGRAMRYSSNTVVVRVTDAPAGPPARSAGPLIRMFAVVLAGLAGLILLGLAFTIVASGARRRARALPPQPAPRIDAEVLPPLDVRKQLAAAVSRLRDAPTRANALHVRSALRELAGARRRETLADILARLNGDDVALRAALRGIEKAAFIEEGRTRSAIEDALPALERVAQP